MASATQDESDEVMNAISMTPLADVMPVLLIIITVPVMQHAINVDLPRVSHQSGNIKPETIRLSIAAGGAYYGNDVAISDAELSSRLQVASANNPQPELHFRGDKDVRCEPVALAMPSAKKSGLRKIGFVTEPQPWLNAMPVNATSIKGAPPAPRSEL